MYFYGLFLAPKLQENFWVLYRIFLLFIFDRKRLQIYKKTGKQLPFTRFFLQNKKFCSEWALLQLIVSYIKYDEFS